MHQQPISSALAHHSAAEVVESILHAELNAFYPGECRQYANRADA